MVTKLINNLVTFTATADGLQTHEWLIKKTIEPDTSFVLQQGETSSIFKTQFTSPDNYTIRHKNTNCGGCTPVDQVVTITDQPIVAEASISPIIIGALVVGAAVMYMKSKPKTK